MCVGVLVSVCVCVCFGTVILFFNIVLLLNFFGVKQCYEHILITIFFFATLMQL